MFWAKEFARYALSNSTFTRGILSSVVGFRELVVYFLKSIPFYVLFGQVYFSVSRW